jgi:hypothetical protein
MKYSKPELSILGTARAVIEFNQPTKVGASIDPGHSSPYLDPAYDLDE